MKIASMAVDVCLFIWVCLSVIIGPSVMIISWSEYGVTDHNLLRVFVKSLRGWIWPVWAVMAVRGYFQNRFWEDWRELFPPRHPAVVAKHNGAQVKGHEYSAGQWRDS